MTAIDLSRMAIYVVGAAETALGEVGTESELSMLAYAARDALTEAGLQMSDVDGIFVNYMGEEGSVKVAEYLGIQPRYADSSDLGGAAFGAFVHHALIAIATGRCDVALIGYASRQRTRRLRSKASHAPQFTLQAQLEDPHGLPIPLGHFALLTARHMYQYGTTLEQLAEVAVAARCWGSLNPRAWRREPLTIADVMNSPMICDPLRKLDCCLITDGGGVVVLAGADRARDARVRPVRVLGAGESHTHWHLTQMRDLTETAAVVSGREAFAMAGVVPADVDFLEPYDACTMAVLLALEDLGFCSKGEGGQFIQTGALRPKGELPSMTSGGGLSYQHPGALGILLIIEAVRQLRGEAGDRQVSGANIGLVHSWGGLLSVASTLILANE